MNIPPDSVPSTLGEFLAGLLATGSFALGEVVVRAAGETRYTLRHRDDAARPDTELERFTRPEAAQDLALHDAAGDYRPLKTAPNLRHGWQLEVAGLPALRLALDGFYPGRLAAFWRWRRDRLATTPLRATLGRQTGMYRVTQKITDEQAVAMVGRFCRSDGGCARTILWTLGAAAGEADALRASLPPEKFDPACDQVAWGEREHPLLGRCLPLLCQEACNLLVAEARAVVKAKNSAGN